MTSRLPLSQPAESKLHSAKSPSLKNFSSQLQNAPENSTLVPLIRTLIQIVNNSVFFSFQIYTSILLPSSVRYEPIVSSMNKENTGHQMQPLNNNLS